MGSSMSQEEKEVGASKDWTSAQRNDREFMLKAVKLNGTCLREASDAVLNDREVVLTAIRTGHNFKLTGGGMVHTPLQYVKDETLLDDRELIMEAICADSYGNDPARMKGKDGSGYVCSGRALEYASPRLRGDRELVIKAVEHWCCAFTFASPDLKADKEFVKMMLPYDNRNLQYASDDLQKDDELLALQASIP